MTDFVWTSKANQIAAKFKLQISMTYISFSFSYNIINKSVPSC
jgi:hypothetical protein